MVFTHGVIPLRANRATVSEEAVLSEAETAVSSDPASAENELRLMDIVVKGYDGEVLTFEHEGREYTVPFDRRCFASDKTLSEPRKCLSEEVINNTLGEAVKAKLKAGPDFSYIGYCDVLSVNGRCLDTPSDPSRISAQEEREYNLKHIGGTKCRLSNCDYTFDVDIEESVIIDNYFDRVEHSLPYYYVNEDLAINVDAGYDPADIKLNPVMYTKPAGSKAGVMEIYYKGSKAAETDIEINISSVYPEDYLKGDGSTATDADKDKDAADKKVRSVLMYMILIVIGLMIPLLVVLLFALRRSGGSKKK